MYKTIVVPIDLSHQEKAASMIDAARLLGDKDGKIVLLNVIEELPASVAAELPGGWLDKTHKDVWSALDVLAKAHDLKAVPEVRNGAAHSVIISFAEENDVDAIVIASHKPGLQDYFLGSTAARVVRHAPCSVHVLR